MTLSKALKQAIDYYNAKEVLDIILNMNNKYNLYDGTNFTFEYDKAERQFFLVNNDGCDLSAGVLTDIEFYDGFAIHFIQLENEEYVAICDTEFND